VWKKAAVAYTELLSGHLLRGRRKTTTNIDMDSRSSGRDLNPGLPKYKAGVFPTPPRGSVLLNIRQGLYTAEHNCSLINRSLSESFKAYSLLSNPFFTDLSVRERGAEERGRNRKTEKFI
jgi:hypothetical protein